MVRWIFWLYLIKQWAAVMMTEGEIKVPPQKKLPLRRKRACENAFVMPWYNKWWKQFDFPFTVKGNSPAAARVPPTMRSTSSSVPSIKFKNTTLTCQYRKWISCFTIYRSGAIERIWIHKSDETKYACSLYNHEKKAIEESQLHFF